MIGFRNSGFLLMLVALCLAFLATCTSETEVVRLTDELTVMPTIEQRPSMLPPIRVVETAAPSLPEEIGSLELVGYLGTGSITTFDLQGDLACIGLGRTLEMVRFTDPARPQRVGYVVLANRVLDVAVASDPSTGQVYAYVALGQDGLAVVDVSNPAHPVVVGTRYEGIHVDAVTVDKDQLYVSAGALYVLDRSDPASPSEISAYRPADAPGNAGKVIAVADGYAYLLYHGASSRAGGLRILDLSAPVLPSTVGVYRVEDQVRDGVINKGYAYLLVGQGIPSLVVVNLDDPSHPVPVNPDGTKAWLGHSLDVDGKTLYLATDESVDGTATVQILDVTDPAHPLPLGIYDGLPLPVVQIVVSGRQVFLAAGGSLIVADLSGSDALAVKRSYDPQRLPSVRRGVVAAGDYIYMAAGLDGLCVIDVSDQAAPRLARCINTRGHAWDVALWDGHAYVAAEQGGLRVIDVRDPARLIEVGAFDAPEPSTFFSDIEIGVQAPLGRAFAYIADSIPGGTSLRVVDISDPAAPRQASRLPLGLGVEGDVRAYGLAVAGDYAYLGVGAAGLRVVDVSDPYAPIEVGALRVPGRADNLVVVDDRVYLVDGDLRIVDVSDPFSPREVGFYDVPSFSSWPYVAVSGRYAFLTAQGTRVLDVSDPGVPIEVADYPLGQGAICVDDGLVFVVGEELYILRPSAEVTPQQTVTPTPECTDYTAEIILSATDTQPYLGDVVTVTVTLINQGCGMLGLPRYSLHGEPDADLSLFAAMPEAAVHYVGMTSGQSDAVDFPLHAVRPGQVTLIAGASFEFHAGYPGPAYWASASGGPLQITVRAPDAGPVPEGEQECLAVREAAIKVCLPDGYSASKSSEQNRRGSFVSYDLEPADGAEMPYLAELQFFTEASIDRFTRDCGLESPCFFGDYPDLERYHGQREALEEQESWDGYELVRLNERAFLVRDLPCYGDSCVIREYTTFVRQIKLDLWVVMDDVSQSQDSDRLLGEAQVYGVEEQ